MSKLAADFDLINFPAKEVQALEPIRTQFERFIERQTEFDADVFVLQRSENYPVILITPVDHGDLAPMRQALADIDIACQKSFAGVKFRDLLSVIEKNGNHPYGIVINASKDLVGFIAASLCEKHAAPPDRVPQFA